MRDNLSSVHVLCQIKNLLVILGRNLICLKSSIIVLRAAVTKCCCDSNELNSSHVCLPVL